MLDDVEIENVVVLDDCDPVKVGAPKTAVAPAGSGVEDEIVQEPLQFPVDLLSVNVP